eukprot:1358547-Pyramimonas_sp.AAC.1
MPWTTLTGNGRPQTPPPEHPLRCQEYAAPATPRTTVTDGERKGASLCQQRRRRPRTLAEPSLAGLGRRLKEPPEGIRRRGVPQ